MANKLRIGVRKFEPFEEAVQHHWDAFVKETGCDYELEAVPMDLNLLYKELFTDGGLKSGAWDIAQVNTDWLAGAKERGDLWDIRKMVEKDPPQDYPDGWSRSMLYFQTYDDCLLGLPFHDGPECFIYRTDLFESPEEQARYQALYHQPLRVPQTWEEFEQVARFFTRPEEGLYGTVFAGYPDRHNNLFDFSIALWTRGGEFVQENGRVVINSPTAVRAMEFYRRIFNDPSLVHPRCRELDSILSGMVFTQGEVAMMVNWFGFATMCETLPQSVVKGKVSIAPIPSDPGFPPVSLNVYYTWSIGSGSKHKDLAYQFIKYCVRKENDRILPLIGAVGCRKSTWDDEEVNQIIPYYHKLGVLHDNAREFPRISGWHSVESCVDDAVVEIVNSDESIQQILDRHQKDLDQALHQ